MKKTLLATLSVVLASSAIAQIKYVDEVLTADKIKVTKNVRPQVLSPRLNMWTKY
jgi:hypothetical protein